MTFYVLCLCFYIFIFMVSLSGDTERDIGLPGFTEKGRLNVTEEQTKCILRIPRIDMNHPLYPSSHRRGRTVLDLRVCNKK